MTAEPLEPAGNTFQDNKQTRISPRHLKLAMMNDEEFNKTSAGVKTVQGGVLQIIHAVLLPKNTEKNKTSAYSNF